MSKTFAEKILDSMVDENGHCGERGLSERQYDIIVGAMTDFVEGEEQYMGCWEGEYKTVYFTGADRTGNVGKYRVTVNKHWRFNYDFNVVSVDLRDREEYEAELEEERRLRELRDFSNSEWIAEPKERLDLDLTLVNVYEYDGHAYSYYDSVTSYIYTFRDADGNCIVWRTKNVISVYDEDSDEWIDAEIGDAVDMKATVKEHGEYKGIKQTVITRPKIAAIAKVR